jgi:hypothetical protein
MEPYMTYLFLILATLSFFAIRIKNIIITIMSTKSIIIIIIILSSDDHNYYQYRVQQILNDPQVKAQQARESNTV